RPIEPSPGNPDPDDEDRPPDWGDDPTKFSRVLREELDRILARRKALDARHVCSRGPAASGTAQGGTEGGSSPSMPDDAGDLRGADGSSEAIAEGPLPISGGAPAEGGDNGQSAVGAELQSPSIPGETRQGGPVASAPSADRRTGLRNGAVREARPCPPRDEDG